MRAVEFLRFPEGQPLSSAIWNENVKRMANALNYAQDHYFKRLDIESFPGLLNRNGDTLTGDLDFQGPNANWDGLQPAEMEKLLSRAESQNGSPLFYKQAKRYKNTTLTVEIPCYGGPKYRDADIAQFNAPEGRNWTNASIHLTFFPFIDGVYYFRHKSGADDSVEFEIRYWPYFNKLFSFNAPLGDPPAYTAFERAFRFKHEIVTANNESALKVYVSLYMESENAHQPPAATPPQYDRIICDIGDFKIWTQCQAIFF